MAEIEPSLSPSSSTSSGQQAKGISSGALEVPAGGLEEELETDLHNRSLHQQLRKKYDQR